MKNQINSLADFRESAKIKLSDLAYLVDLSSNHLRKIENGEREPSIMVVLIYHILFGAQPEDVLADMYADLHALLIERSQRLIANLKKKQSPKSLYRIKSISKIVNSLNNGSNEFVN